jgi:hypothetical protein
MTIERQMSGEIERRWAPEGLAIEARIPLAMLSAD